jgi:paraquat-inducible protein A
MEESAEAGAAERSVQHSQKFGSFYSSGSILWNRMRALQTSRHPTETVGLTQSLPPWIECPYCGLFQRLPTTSGRHVNRCARCLTPFGSRRLAMPDALPVAITAALLFALAQIYPLLGIEMQGLTNSVRIESGTLGLLDRGLSPLAALVLLVSFAAPIVRIVASAYVLARAGQSKHRANLAWLFRTAERMRPWAMLDVLLLGTLIAIAKLNDVAEVDPGIGLWMLGLLVLALAWLDSSIDRRAIWDALGPSSSSHLESPSPAMACRVCGFICHGEDLGRPRRCERCGAQIRRRQINSLGRSWALVITGLFLYIPANTYPALTVTSFGRETSATILGGVQQLMNGQDWPLALLIFTASIAVPVLKLLGLTGLLLSIQLRMRAALLVRTRLYRVIQFIGRWSTIDVFVAALLTALVALGQIATIEPGFGILAFGAVVVTTMFAAESFDPRLMWDAAGRSDD